MMKMLMTLAAFAPIAFAEAQLAAPDAAAWSAHLTVHTPVTQRDEGGRQLR